MVATKKDTAAAAKVEAEQEKAHEEGVKQREQDAKDTEGDADTTEDPTTARDLDGTVIEVVTEDLPGGAISQPLTTVPVTYTDSLGIARVAGGFDDGWEPAPVDPDPALVRQNQAAMDRIEQAHEETAKRMGTLGANESLRSRDAKANEENAKSSSSAKDES